MVIRTVNRVQECERPLKGELSDPCSLGVIKRQEAKKKVIKVAGLGVS